MTIRLIRNPQGRLTLRRGRGPLTVLIPWTRLPKITVRVRNSAPTAAVSHAAPTARVRSIAPACRTSTRSPTCRIDSEPAT